MATPEVDIASVNDASARVLRSPCATNTPTAMEAWSCVRDEGGPLGTSDQERVPNHRELLS